MTVRERGNAQTRSPEGQTYVWRDRGGHFPRDYENLNVLVTILYNYLILIGSAGHRISIMAGSKSISIGQ